MENRGPSAGNDQDFYRPLLEVNGVTRLYLNGLGCRDISFVVHPGEVVGIVGESGSGKSTLLSCISGRATIDKGSVIYDMEGVGPKNIFEMSEVERERLALTEWGIIHQNPRDGVRMDVSAGGNIGERQMSLGLRHYGKIRQQAGDWLEKVEIDLDRIDDTPKAFSGGMQQRLQIARNLVTHPRLVFMDEPTGGLDISVQARIVDLLRALVRELGLAVIIVTHDLPMVRLLADRLLVMQRGTIIEEGLTDQVLDDPHHPYTQLLVSSLPRA
ncbi:phosphonate C-P lyase system protein PhnK [Phyllobacterium sophorae]|uniref:Phosphonate C-P lyase system protein PhnK n=1 Tax=Phyllobacterium sophorae TaxID=1520277 RepID=A0A2P7AQJ3_9HYPH|nr:phosphonate C-P lyase system protein PhnK [Phyllobacterium sophorae]PSH56502.1 phosphonate C-P lyase system protein PhnK [Phyllobacterium sophorae]